MGWYPPGNAYFYSSTSVLLEYGGIYKFLLTLVIFGPNPGGYNP